MLMLVAAVGCGSSAKEQASDVISAGQVDIKLPPGWKVSTDGKSAVRPASVVASSETPGAATGAGADAGGETEDTVPLAKEDPTTKFFGALSTFQSCLKGLNVKFIGVPNQADPSSPANDPNYIKALSTCAAKSNILQALKDQQAAQDNLTPEQIKEQNKGYLVWRDCMTGRGWGIPEPKPDSKGRLFSFGAGGGSGSQQPPAFDPPPGEDIITSSDVQECATEAQREVQPDSGG